MRQAAASHLYAELAAHCFVAVLQLLQLLVPTQLREDSLSKFFTSGKVVVRVAQVGVSMRVVDQLVSALDDSVVEVRVIIYPLAHYGKAAAHTALLQQRAERG